MNGKIRSFCQRCGGADGFHASLCNTPPVMGVAIGGRGRPERPVMSERADSGPPDDSYFQSKFDSAIRRGWPQATKQADQHGRSRQVHDEMTKIIDDVARQVDEITGIGQATDHAYGRIPTGEKESSWVSGARAKVLADKRSAGEALTGAKELISGLQQSGLIDEDDDADDSSPVGGKLRGDSYYRVAVAEPMESGVAPYVAECADIIEALGMTFNEGEAFKALWRLAAARRGKVKPGAAGPQYDADKVAHYGARVAAQTAQEVKKGWKT